MREQWEYKPFYWLSPSGREKVWGALGGYSIGHEHRSVIDAVSIVLERLAQVDYPYDIVQLRWSKGDNGRPDEGVMNAVRDWNTKYVYPRLIIATTSEAFHDFEQRYGAKPPTFRGDLTPYWEDGTGSAARETVLNRHPADRLLQAETLWAMQGPRQFPFADIAAAWKNVALWSEHTWGAHNSVREPDLPFVTAQWRFKQAFAKDADRQSQTLLDKVLLGRPRFGSSAGWDVFNTTSWPRTDLGTLPKETKGDGVKDEQGNVVPSQRLSTGELAFLARDIPPFAAKWFVVDESAPPGGHAQVEGAALRTPALSVRLDETTGAIASLRQAGLAAELANGQINNYLYLPGADVKDAKPNGSAKLSVKEAGPLVVSLVAESKALGCENLVREVRVLDGLDRVEIIDSMDKTPVRAVEGVHFGFAFNVPNPEVRINSPGAVVRSQQDQLPGACKNWFSVERWVDISNKDYGVTWGTADAPLVEIGGLTANLPRKQPNPNAYMKHIAPAATLYSWVMNNHWHTNYRADQEGWVTFRYAIHPHGIYDAGAAARCGIENTQPLIVAPAVGRGRLDRASALNRPKSLPRR